MKNNDPFYEVVVRIIAVLIPWFLILAILTLIAYMKNQPQQATVSRLETIQNHENSQPHY